jgi:hypothetical protein
LLRSCGEFHDYFQPVRRAISAGYVSSARLDAVSHDRQSQACAPGFPLPSKLGPIKRPKQIIDLRVRNSGPAIGNFNLNATVMGGSRDFDWTRGAGVPDRVPYDVGERPKEVIWRCHDFKRSINLNVNHAFWG